MSIIHYMVQDKKSKLFLKECVLSPLKSIDEGKTWKTAKSAHCARTECIGRPMYDDCEFVVVPVKVTVELV